MQNNITILISHDSKDEAIASEIKTFLEDVFLNVNVYVSGRDLIGGQTWIEEIKSRLKSAQVIISLITKKSLKNNWLYFESGAGFTEDKTIPLLTDNLKPSELIPPLSLLQVRIASENGIENLIKDLAIKMNLREPKNYPNIKSLIGRIVKMLRSQDTLSLRNILSERKFSLSEIKQWIFEENCLVHDFVFTNKHHVAVDTYFYMDRTEIHLFGRKNSEKFVLDEMCKKSGFLPKAKSEYETNGNRLIFNKISSSEKLEVVADSLIDLLNRVGVYELL